MWCSGEGGGCCVVSFSFRGMKEANPPWSQAACRCWFSPVPRRGPSRGGPQGRSRAARPLPLGCVREQWFQAAWGGSCVLCVLLLGHSPLCFSAVPRFQQLLVLVVCFGCVCFFFFFKFSPSHSCLELARRWCSPCLWMPASFVLPTQLATGSP